MGAVLRQGAVKQEAHHYFSAGSLAIQPKKTGNVRSCQHK
jgi:hypothetical protein